MDRAPTIGTFQPEGLGRVRSFNFIATVAEVSHVMGATGSCFCTVLKGLVAGRTLVAMIVAEVKMGLCFLWSFFGNGRGDTHGQRCLLDFPCCC